ncbi:MAG: HAD-IA family hydrolase [Kistimonas sp.]|nr:HAD-IA family hydrolase [Kistimonas sp.]
MNTTTPDPLEAVFFDLDGTLLDTSMDFCVLLNGWRVGLGLSLLSTAEVCSRISGGIRALTALACAKPVSCDEPAFERLCQRFLDHYERMVSDPRRASASRLFDGMDRVLEKLETLSIPWGVVTNKPRRFAEPLLQSIALPSPCAVLVCPDDVSKSKPDPEPLLLAASSLGVAPQHCLYIGDHLVDIQAGSAACMVTLAAAYGFLEQEASPADWGADAIVHSPAALLKWLEDNKLQAASAVAG